MKNKILSVLLAVLIFATVIPFATVPASAALAMQTVDAATFLPYDGRFEALHNSDSSVGNWISYGYSITSDTFDNEDVIKIAVNGEEFKGVASKDASNVKSWGYMPANLYRYDAMTDTSGKTIKAVNANYIAIDYYYDTSGRADESEEGRSSLENLGMIWIQNSLTSGNSAYEVKNSTNKIVADEWATIYIPVNYSDKAADENDALGQFAFHPFGKTYGNPMMYTGDALYISEIRFSTYDPENFELSTRFVDYYLSESAYEEGDCYFSDDAEDLTTIELVEIPEEDLPEGKTFGGWKELSTGTVYQAGAQYTLTSAEDVEFVALWKTDVTYYSADGVVDGVTEYVYSSFGEAIAAVEDGGTVYIDGDLSYKAGEIYVDSKTSLAIKGFNTDASFTTLEYNVRFIGNNTVLTIDDINIIRADGSEGEAHLGIQNGKLIIGDGVTYTSGTANSGHWNPGMTLNPQVGLAEEVTASQAYEFNSSALAVDYMAPAVGYLTSGIKTLTGDFSATVNAGTFTNIFGMARNTAAGMREHNGNTEYTINGGNITNIYTGALNYGKTTGNITFTVNGGNIGNIYLGNRNAHDGKNTANHTFVVFNVADIVNGGYTLPMVSEGVELASHGSNVIIYNNAEKYSGEYTYPISTTQFITVRNGKLIPNSDGTFKAYSDDGVNNTVFANGVAVSHNADGNYSFEEAFVNVTFGTGTTTRMSFDGVESDYVVGSYLTLPAGKAQNGKIFGAWLCNGTYYSEGERFEVPDSQTTTVFESVYVDVTSGDVVLYVDQQNGDDANSGVISQLPLKTLSSAANLYMNKYLSYNPIVNIVGTYEGESLYIPYANNITYTGGTLAYSEALVVNMPTKFKNISLKCLTPYKYVEIGSSGVQFLEGVRKAEDSEDVSVHFGPSGAFSQEYLNVTTPYTLSINSGDFTTVFVGPSYLDTSAPTVFSNLFTVNFGGNAVVNTVQISDGYGDYSNKCTIDNSIVITVKDDAELSKVSSMNKYCESADALVVYNYTDDPVRHITYNTTPDCAPTYIYNISGFEPTFDLQNPSVISFDGDFYTVSDGEYVRAQNGKLTVPTTGAYGVCGGKTVLDTLTVIGAQIRVTGEQALRFIANYDYALDEMYTPDEYGFVLLPAVILGEDELTADGVYSYNGTAQYPGVVPAVRLYSEGTDSKQYTVCVTGLNTEAKLARDYTVRAYIKVDGEYIYGDQYSTSVKDIENAALDVKYAISELHYKYSRGRLTDEELTERIDTISKTQIDYIVNAESEYPTTGNVFYVSNSGNDSNNGTSPLTAWKTLANLTSAKLSSGDTVLFERGGTWRGSIDCVAGVTYSAYGEGRKPTILGSARNYADPSLWTTTATPCVYEYTGTIDNPGIIVFNASDDYGNYNEIVGTLDGFLDYSNLDSDLEFAPIITDGKLYIYSFYGNPGDRFDSIEIGTSGRIFNVDEADNVTIDNIRIRFGGGHGIGTNGAKNLTVRNCVIDYVGGSKLTYHTYETTRYGNAIESYGGCDGFYVYDNWCYQAFDTGITHQYNVSTIDKHDCYMDDVYYSGNVVEYCHWGIEWYNYDNEGTQQYVKNVNITDNICRMTGYGWGSRGGAYREASIATLCSWGLTPDTEGFVLENNIFDRSMGKMFLLNDIYDDGTDGNMLIDFVSNIFVQGSGDLLGTIFGSDYNYNELTASAFEEIFGDTTNVFSYNNDSDKVNYTPLEG